MKGRSRRLLSALCTKYIAVLLAAALATGLFAAMPIMAGAASDAGTIDISEAWFGSGADYKAYMPAWEYTDYGNTIKAYSNVAVVGKATGASRSLHIEAGAGATILWKAEYEASHDDIISAIYLRGAGTFEVPEGGSIKNTGNGDLIWAEGHDGIRVVVSGGTLSSIKAAIVTTAKEPTVTVSGGTVESTGANNGTIKVNCKLEISGGTVSSAGASMTVTCEGAPLIISGGSIKNTGTGTAVMSYGDGASLAISGGLVENFGSGQTVNADDVTISGGTVRSRGTSQAFTMHNMDISGGVVGAGDGLALYPQGVEKNVNVSGGFVFAHGVKTVRQKGDFTDAKDNVIDGFSHKVTISGSGIVCAWNKDAGRNEYTEDTADDLVSEPAGKVKWGIDAALGGGIRYANGATAGFYPIDGITVKPAGGGAAISPSPEPSPSPSPVSSPSPGAGTGDGGSKYKASDWAVPEIAKADALGLIPDSIRDQDLTKPITRKEFAGVCVRLYEELSGNTAKAASVNPFADVSDLDVLKAFNTGLMVGTAADKFSPSEILNRQTAATALTRVLKKCYITAWSFETDGRYKLNFIMPKPFPDDAKIDDWAKPSVYFMASKGIIKGMENGDFAPQNTTTREEASGYANSTREQALAIAVRIASEFRDKLLDYDWQ